MTVERSEPVANAVIGTLLKNHRRFLDFLTARVGSRADAEEILQDAFVRSTQKAGDIRDDESSVAWFYRLLRNAVIDYHRRKASGSRTLESYSREAAEADPGLDADLERAVCECVNDLIPVLKPEYADLIRRV